MKKVAISAALFWLIIRGISAAQQPNIVLIMADDLGYEAIGANGGTSYQTPVLDEMAQQGVRFEHCYAQPLCTPSRVQIMTGLYNVRNYTRFGKLERDQVTFAHLLKDAGYATCVVGKWQLGREDDSPQHFGFDESCLWQQQEKRVVDGVDSRFENPVLSVNGEVKKFDGGRYGPDVVSNFAMDFMERHKDGPFLVYYPMILTHCPFVPTPESADWNPDSPGSKSYVGDPKYFGDMVSYMDAIIGRIQAKLEELGVAQNTLILFTGDNGTDSPVTSEWKGRQIQGGKRGMKDNGTRVPLIVQWPGNSAKGLVTDDLVDFSDFLPTLCAAAGVELPADIPFDGRSFLPRIRGEDGNPREWIYCWYSPRGNEDQAREFARDQEYKLYDSGKFYHIPSDRDETSPLNLDEAGEEAKQAHAKLKEALAQYDDQRGVDGQE